MALVSSGRCNRISILGFSFFFFNDTATTEIYTLSLHDALPISSDRPGNGNGNAYGVGHAAEGDDPGNAAAPSAEQPNQAGEDDAGAQGNGNGSGQAVADDPGNGNGQANGHGNGNGNGNGNGGVGNGNGNGNAKH